MWYGKSKKLSGVFGDYSVEATRVMESFGQCSSYSPRFDYRLTEVRPRISHLSRYVIRAALSIDRSGWGDIITAGSVDDCAFACRGSKSGLTLRGFVHLHTQPELLQTALRVSDQSMRLHRQTHFQ